MEESKQERGISPAEQSRREKRLSREIDTTKYWLERHRLLGRIGAHDELTHLEKTHANQVRVKARIAFGEARKQYEAERSDREEAREKAAVRASEDTARAAEASARLARLSAQWGIAAAIFAGFALFASLASHRLAFDSGEHDSRWRHDQLHALEAIRAELRTQPMTMKGVE